MLKDFWDVGTYFCKFEALPSVNYPEGYREVGSAFIGNILKDKSNPDSVIGKELSFVLKRNVVEDLLLEENFLDDGLNVSIDESFGSTKSGTYKIVGNKLTSCKRGFSYTLGGYFITKKVIVKKCNQYFTTWFYKNADGKWVKYGSGCYKKL